MPFRPISNLVTPTYNPATVNVFPAVPFDAYLLVYHTSNDFLANFDGSTTEYPHRALLFRKDPLLTKLYRLFQIQNQLTYLDFVHIRLSTDADFVPTNITQTPTAFRFTPQISSSAFQPTKPLYIDNTPDVDPYACGVPPEVAFCEAIARVAATLNPVTLFMETTPGTYAPVFIVSLVSIP